jgi:hypothetical protein
MTYETGNEGQEQRRKRKECLSPGHGLEAERMGQSAIARLVTPKAYQYERVCDRIDQQERDRKRMDSALVREEMTINTSSPPTGDEVKNEHVQEVEEWIITTVNKTLCEYIKSKALEKTMEKRINEEMARSNWEMNLEEPCEGMVKEDVAMAMKKKISAMICFGTMKEVIGNHIVNAIDFDEIKATAMATILKTKSMQKRVSEMVEKVEDK